MGQNRRRQRRSISGSGSGVDAVAPGAEAEGEGGASSSAVLDESPRRGSRARKVKSVASPPEERARAAADGEAKGRKRGFRTLESGNKCETAAGATLEDPRLIWI